MLLLCFTGPDVPSCTACYFGYVWTMMKLPKQAPWTAYEQPGISLFELNILSPDINAWEPLLYLDLRATRHRLLTGFLSFCSLGFLLRRLICLYAVWEALFSLKHCVWFSSWADGFTSFFVPLPLFGYFTVFVVFGGIIGV
ncbi:hypothetical protein MA16_Dca016407 [Dendrobium catenatum]|uniref:Uncharacterized protein n=1 Tax=Dendrobium catenatum TaxID=906689 RepID=A0A2I0VVB2_9ASPA|nr:hypothetical protein MA16_Dca016407 [Dendrobium catenatum]